MTGQKLTEQQMLENFAAFSGDGRNLTLEELQWALMHNYTLSLVALDELTLQQASQL